MAAARDHFPALRREESGRQVAFLDGPAGTQLPIECIEAMVAYMRTSHANTGGAFGTSAETDRVLRDAHAATADFLGAHDPAEIAFGANMTTLTFAFTRGLGRDFRPGDEIVLSRMDHDANLAPWLTVARERGLVVRWIEVRPDDATLDLDSLELALGPRTRIVAVSLASNAVGSLTDMGRVVEMAHASGALLFVDAVHAAAHVPIDVSAMRTDFLVCSPYKFYGPHLGVLYGRRELLERVDTDRVRPAGDALPARLETGTLSHEALAGLLGTYAYLSSLGRVSDRSAANGDRRESLRAAMMAIRAYERELTAPLLGGLASVPGIRVLGISDPARAAERVPTVAFTVADFHPRRVAESLAARAINVWDGTMYAPELMRALGVDASSGGVVRAGLVHYNTTDEIDRLVTALTEMVAAGS